MGLAHNLTFEQFQVYYNEQLQGIPELYWQALYVKLVNEVRYFQKIEFQIKKFLVLVRCIFFRSKNAYDKVFLTKLTVKIKKRYKKLLEAKYVLILQYNVASSSNSSSFYYFYRYMMLENMCRYAKMKRTIGM